MIIQGNCLDVMKTKPDNSVDSIVTDPPYGLSFMGKKWDYDVPGVEIWRECLRVLKPGGYLLAFAGTRTQHRMCCNIEDAGFEIRDMIAWVYGSGFPKSLNIGKAVDKLQGNEREVVGDMPYTSPDFSDEQFVKQGSMMQTHHKAPRVTVKKTKGTSPWEGWGTAIKPALEPITVARKPLGEKTVAKNVLKWGVGGINIDGCRVDIAKERCIECDGSGELENPYRKCIKCGGAGEIITDGIMKPPGRFPANLIHDGSDEVVDLFPGKEDKSASRFFYCAKASKKDRGKGNNHPTVKPTELMRYLVRLVTSKNGIVLDPFMGSGSTGRACKLEGFRFIGIEMNPEYIEIAKARIQ